ncbi:MAG: hypothetical protein QXG56_00275 [Candidatus Bathyarchaeia archaeon]
MQTLIYPDDGGLDKTSKLTHLTILPVESFMDGRLVSVVQLEKLLFHIPEVCWIGKVFTSQKYRGMGFAAS